MPLHLPSIFGVGLAYPMRLDPTGTKPLVAKEEALVKMAMAQIMSTRQGERPFLVRGGVPYGTRLTDALFENSDTAEDIIRYEVRAALETWEARIVVDEVTTRQIDAGFGGVIIEARVRFRYRSTNREDNFVLPYRTTNPDATVQ